MFQGVITELVNIAIHKAFMSDPAHHKERESAYYDHRALTSIVDVLKLWKSVGDAAAEETDDEEN